MKMSEINKFNREQQANEAIEFATWLLINCDTPIFRDSERIFTYYQDKRHHTIKELYNIYINEQSI